MWFSLYKNCKWKVKLWSVGAFERKKRAFYVPFILPEGHFFNICIFSQCIVYWINFHNIHTLEYTYKHYAIFSLLLKSSKAFSVSFILLRQIAIYIELCQTQLHIKLCQTELPPSPNSIKLSWQLPILKFTLTYKFRPNPKLTKAHTYKHHKTTTLPQVNTLTHA